MPQISKYEFSEKLLQVRNYLIAGYNRQQIMYAMKLSDQTFKKYTDRIYEEDALMLAQKKERAIASDIVIYKSRLEKALLDLDEF